MGRKKAEINPIRAERLKILIDREKKIRHGDFSQIKFAESINMAQQNVSRIIQMHQALYEQTARHIIEQYPNYRIEWLLGYDDYMTLADWKSAYYENLSYSEKVELFKKLTNELISKVFAGGEHGKNKGDS